MKIMAHICALALVLLLPTGAANATVDIDLDGDDRVATYDAYVAEPVPDPYLDDWDVGVGGHAPDDVVLYDTPDVVEFEPYEDYDYTVYRERVIVVDPETREVIDVIER